jgi:hypothetical protein
VVQGDRDPQIVNRPLAHLLGVLEVLEKSVIVLIMSMCALEPRTEGNYSPR